MHHLVLPPNNTAQYCKSCASTCIDAADAKNAIHYLEEVKEWRENLLQYFRADELTYNEEEDLEQLGQIGNLTNAIRLLNRFLIAEN